MLNVNYKEIDFCFCCIIVHVQVLFRVVVEARGVVGVCGSQPMPKVGPWQISFGPRSLFKSPKYYELATYYKFTPDFGNVSITKW